MTEPILLLMHRIGPSMCVSSGLSSLNSGVGLAGVVVLTVGLLQVSGVLAGMFGSIFRVFWGLVFWVLGRVFCFWGGL